MTCLVLGSGFVGQAFCAGHLDAVRTQRSVPRPDLFNIEFELSRPSTWKNLPNLSQVLWTFPAANDPEEIKGAVDFYEQVLQGRDVLLLGSTSAYHSLLSDEKITEDFPLMLQESRVCAEELLRQRGASILHLAGIFGGARDPVNWLRRGLIHNGASFVNLIHISDIVIAIDAWFAKPKPFERLNLSNGKPRRWNEIVDELKLRNELPEGFILPEMWPPVGSKQVAIEKICMRLNLARDRLIDFPISVL